MNICDPGGLRDPLTDAAADERLGAVLAAMRDAEPETGLEGRILQRLGSEAPVGKVVTWARWKMWPRLAVPTGLALSALCIAAVLLRHAAPAPAAADAAKQSVAQTTSRSLPVAAHVGTGDPVISPRLSHAARVRSEATTTAAPVHASKMEGRGKGALLARSREASFPAPAMPLTEQERLLLQIAHRNDPVQVAMLDPVERNLQIARERAESARFFTPPPLPPSLQHEINAALRAQYVNTPPPNDLN